MNFSRSHILDRQKIGAECNNSDWMKKKKTRKPDFSRLNIVASGVEISAVYQITFFIYAAAFDHLLNPTCIHIVSIIAQNFTFYDTTTHPWANVVQKRMKSTFNLHLSSICDLFANSHVLFFLHRQKRKIYSIFFLWEILESKKKRPHYKQQWVYKKRNINIRGWPKNSLHKFSCIFFFFF